MLLCAPRGTDLALGKLRALYAMSGTERAHAPTRVLRNIRYSHSICAYAGLGANRRLSRRGRAEAGCGPLAA
eukprot:509616-Rhodomonas_salina.3